MRVLPLGINWGVGGAVFVRVLPLGINWGVIRGAGCLGFWSLGCNWDVGRAGCLGFWSLGCNSAAGGAVCLGF